MAGTMALCKRHHEDYDQGRIDCERLTEQGCDGLLRWRTANGTTYIEE